MVFVWNIAPGVWDNYMFATEGGYLDRQEPSTEQVLVSGLVSATLTGFMREYSSLFKYI